MAPRIASLSFDYAVARSRQAPIAKCERSWRALYGFETRLRNVYLYRRLRVCQMVGTLTESQQAQLRRLESIVADSQSADGSEAGPFGGELLIQSLSDVAVGVQAVELSVSGATLWGANEALPDSPITLVCPLRVIDHCAIHFPARAVQHSGGVQALVFTGAPHRVALA